MIMGYFSNGTEGEIYFQSYCEKCIHGDSCPVWDAHLAFNYDCCNATGTPGKAILDALIPRQGIENLQCTMFVRRNADGDLFETGR